MVTSPRRRIAVAGASCALMAMTSACGGPGVPDGVAGTDWRLVAVTRPDGVLDVRSVGARLTVTGESARWFDGVNHCDGTVRPAGAGLAFQAGPCTAAGYAGPPDSPVAYAREAFRMLTSGAEVQARPEHGSLLLIAGDRQLRFTS